MDCPQKLYRAFKDECYAQDFIRNGTIRLFSLAKYRHVDDDSRRDSDEGSAKYHQRLPEFKNSIQEIDETHANQYYILCASGPEVNENYLKAKYGKFVVKINSPVELMEDIRSQCPKHITSIELKPVEYTRGRKRLMENREPGSLISITQKSISDSKDCEYRYILMSTYTRNYDYFSDSADAENLCIEVDLKCTPKYLEKLW